MRRDTHAAGGRICRVPLATVPGADIHPQCVLARVGSAPNTQPKFLEVVAQVGVGMSEYLGG